MDIAFLKKIYPNSFFTSQKPDQTYLAIKTATDYLAIPQAELSETEVKLLTNIKQEYFEQGTELPENNWHHYLFFDGALPPEKGNFRSIQFLLSSENKEENKEWLLAFENMFNQPVSSFFVSPSFGVLIEKEDKNRYSLEEIEGILKTLESDFGIKGKVFVGVFLPLDEEFKKLFHEQMTIFLSEQNQIKYNQAVQIAELSLSYLTKKNFQNSSLMTYFAEKIALEPEMAKIIEALWHNQGNISSAAKELFMHRNTLRYRIEKFHEQTSLSLKSMDDLVLAYLFVQHKK
ncbi:PucR family transcriptional regulator [Vagococcus elongatus]|uniref:PucR C-terminal helix-turn-helix domain-containing protein n=1 Tax=Vagococcus elongatus TaxID=180344 RepID=A0A430AMU4_9ENTE|nr:helix-turn-helix domain-containing protein [Vagococcus elongatus]RSU09442.1 hypothetical protein CBF29_11360 [Vagococcus elongatus]